LPIDSRALPRRDVVDALDEVGIAATWVTGEQIRGGIAGDGIEVADLEKRLPKANSAFRNQIVGRIAERTFRGRYLSRLEPEFEVNDYHARGDNRDYGVSDNTLELPINVKTASTIFRNAAQFGLDPEDCIPISSYKALNAIDKVPDLVYVDLVDFTLRAKTDAVMDGLQGSLGILWDLFSWYGGKGAKKAQDAYVDRVFTDHGAALDALAPGVTRFRAISAHRTLAILRDNPRRCPGLGVKAAGTGTFNAEVNVHVSVENETMPWDDIEEMIREMGIASVLALIRETETREVRAPKL
jgi:hypothetical protein